MYLVAQISPFEWKKASVCNHYDEDDDDKMNDEFHHHSSNSLNCEENDFMTNRETSITTMRIEENTMELLEGENEKIISKEQSKKEEVVEKEVGDGNCCENYNTSTLQQHQQYFKNMCLMNEQNDLESIWINMESNRNFFIERQQIGSSKHLYNENLDIDDDGLIGYADNILKQVHNKENVRGLACEKDAQEFTLFDDESQNIELISYVNNFSLKNSFAWTLGTLLQTSSELVPKV